MSVNKQYVGPSSDLEPDLDVARRFLAKWFGGQCVGDIEIGFMSPKTGALNVFKRFPVEDLDAAAEYACEKNKVPGASTYIRPGLIKVGASGFVTDTDFLSSPGFWADYDDEKSVLQLKTRTPPDCQPDITVVTGRHPHLRIQTYRRAHGGVADGALQKKINECIAAATGGDAAVKNPSSLMRLPGTIAWPWKDGRIPELTECSFNGHSAHNGYRVEYIERAFAEADECKTTEMLLQCRTFDMADALENIRAGKELHENSLKIMASLVAQNVSDTNIIAFLGHILEPVSDGGTIKNLPSMLQWIHRQSPEIGGLFRRDSLPLIFADETSVQHDAGDFVEDLLVENSLTVVYGESGGGKTFWTLDLALTLATGLPFMGKRTEQAGVVYCALEGGRGVSNRIEAWKKRNRDCGQISFSTVPSSINLLNSDADVSALLDAVERVGERLVDPVRLIVIDTLSRALSGGNENSPEHMGALVKAADLIRQRTGACVLFVHHSGKDQAKGARGHSSLRAATDTEIEILRDQSTGICSAIVRKQRDLPDGVELHFRLEVVDLGVVNRWGRPVTSCIVAPVDNDTRDAAKAEVKRKKGPGSKNQNVALSELRSLINTEGVAVSHRGIPEDVKTVSYEALIAATADRITSTKPRDRAHEAVKALIGTQMENQDGYVWLLE
jgi:hypothetical protein